MTAVSRDKHGLYVLKDGRVGRPRMGQAADVAEGDSVRVTVMDGAVRVRYSNKSEEDWSLHLSRREGPAVPLGFNLDGTVISYEVGQVWLNRKNQHVRIDQLLDKEYQKSGKYAIAKNLPDGNRYYVTVKGQFFPGHGDNPQDLVSLAPQGA